MNTYVIFYVRLFHLGKYFQDYPLYSIYQYFTASSWTKFHCMHITHLFIHSSVAGHQDCFYFLDDTEQKCYKHLSTSFCEHMHLVLLYMYQRGQSCWIMQYLYVDSFKYQETSSQIFVLCIYFITATPVVLLILTWVSLII